MENNGAHFFYKITQSKIDLVVFIYNIHDAFIAI
jgi:hypothetical protein